ncbi:MULTISPECIES: DUF4367 domain-containing protein [Paenibacillus]|uniref:DUF4367 domain-containing protein n=2 Tax=Paenibacillus macerans TaxID=44252 RepID=A0A6N8F0D0_PAEMA|nr:DUF4367 domain-containing protein [Paenibacillus macerans]MUG24530.1 DUF4367 domain-containing protein [Paenibacillus macerans]
MPKINNPMDSKLLEEEYEKIKIKLLMIRFAELEGKMLLDENTELSNNPLYLLSEKTKLSFIMRLNRHFAFYHLKQTIRFFATSYKKVAVLLAVFLFAVALNVEAVRVKVLNMFIQVQEEYTEIRLGQGTQHLKDSHLQINWENAYVPTEVPEGYRIEEVKNLQNIKSIEYVNDSDGYILFQQNNENSGMNVDTEEADELSHTTIQGHDGLIVRKKNVVTLVWQNEGRLFLILGDSPQLRKEELVKMAESVTLVK